MPFCRSYFKSPVSFAIIALIVDYGLNQIFHSEAKKKVYIWISKITTIASLILFARDLYSKGKSNMSLPAVVWFFDLITTIFATAVITQNYPTNTIELITNPCQQFLDIIYSKSPLQKSLSPKRKALLILSAIIESFLYWPFIKEWSKKHCFIDNMMDFSSPFGIYSTSMILIMYFNIVPYLYTVGKINILLKSIMTYLAFHNINYLVVLLFILIPK